MTAAPELTTTTAPPYPYPEDGVIDYDRLDFDPFELEPLPESMEQNPIIVEMVYTLVARFASFEWRGEVFIDHNSDICYDRRNLNVRIRPDVFLAFDVPEGLDIHARSLYLPWEAGKPPDWVLEVGSKSTGEVDTGRKRRIYAEIGVPEYWRFDPSGGDHHGAALAGDRLVNGAYEPIALTSEPDGILKGYSEVLELYFCWDDGNPRFYDPVSGEYLENMREIWEARQDAETRIAGEQSARQDAETRAAAAENRADAAETQRDDVLSENEQLRAEVERLRAELDRR